MNRSSFELCLRFNAGSVFNQQPRNIVVSLSQSEMQWRVLIYRWVVELNRVKIDVFIQEKAYLIDIANFSCIYQLNVTALHVFPEIFPSIFVLIGACWRWIFANLRDLFHVFIVSDIINAAVIQINYLILSLIFAEIPQQTFSRWFFDSLKELLILKLIFFIVFWWISINLTDSTILSENLSWNTWRRRNTTCSWFITTRTRIEIHFYVGIMKKWMVEW